MPKLDRTGPEGKGPKTGRGLGTGRKVDGNDWLEKLGRGIEKRRHSDCAEGEGKGKRLNYNKPK